MIFQVRIIQNRTFEKWDFQLLKKNIPNELFSFYNLLLTFRPKLYEVQVVPLEVKHGLKLVLAKLYHRKVRKQLGTTFLEENIKDNQI